MSWKGSIMDQRREFVALASQEGANRRELCRRFGISAPTAYKWLGRAQSGTQDWPEDKSRRPLHSPKRTFDVTEAAVLAVRDAHPAWGARKIAWTLERQGIVSPAPSTVHGILQRHGRIMPSNMQGKATGRFEHPAPNLLWQMDFKGRTKMVGGHYVHPLTVVDDHSRYALCLEACENETTQTVQTRLTKIFARYGMPDLIIVDNGSPWGGGGGESWTRLGVWLLKLEIGVVHSRPYHPQTRGKNERFHRTVIDEVLAARLFRNLIQVQKAFDEWRVTYNTLRPHEGIGMNPPASRYQPSSRQMPAKLKAVEYDSSEIVRSVGTTKSYISFKGEKWKVPQAFLGERLAIRPSHDDGHFGIYFGVYKIAAIDLKSRTFDV